MLMPRRALSQRQQVPYPIRHLLSNIECGCEVYVEISGGGLRCRCDQLFPAAATLRANLLHSAELVWKQGQCGCDGIYLVSINSGVLLDTVIAESLQAIRF